MTEKSRMQISLSNILRFLADEMENKQNVGYKINVITDMTILGILP